ncbi:MAG: hypothetical protein IM638_01570 [Bacteroidetes bacterium]|nr:hypothetical protein [Bacteroidota bacterium]
MGRYSTLPTLYNECRKLTASKLNKWGYIQPGGIVSGVISWSKNGHKTGEVSASLSFAGALPVLTLNYCFNKEPREFTVQLTSRQSNLGRGLVWYFVCPKTGLLCSKLYLINGYFVRRATHGTGFYHIQTMSKSDRVKMQLYERFFRCENAYMALYSKHFKKTYNGKPTHRYMKVMQHIRQGEGINEEELYI